jgi:hypothetical protein
LGYRAFSILVLLLGWLSGAIAQSDPFIDTIEQAKRSVAPVICVNQTSPGVFNIPSIDGSAFLIDDHGTFLTAAHVVKDFLPGSPLSQCGAAAIYLPLDKWGTGNIRWLRFFPEDCVFDSSSDISKCRTVDDVAGVKELLVKPSHFVVDDEVKRDGTAVAFTGFPLNAVIPYTSRANILAYPIVSPPKPGATTVILDKAAWPGASGSPIYLVDGKVIGLMTQRGEGVAAGIAVAVDGRAISRFLKAHPDK